MERYDWTEEETKYILQVVKEKNVTAYHGSRDLARITACVLHTIVVQLYFVESFILLKTVMETSARETQEMDEAVFFPRFTSSAL